MKLSCVGMTKQNKRCRNTRAKYKVASIIEALDDLSNLNPNNPAVKLALESILEIAFCHLHPPQAPKILDQWLNRIQDRHPLRVETPNQNDHIRGVQERGRVRDQHQLDLSRDQDRERERVRQRELSRERRGRERQRAEVELAWRLEENARKENAQKEAEETRRKEEARRENERKKAKEIARLKEAARFEKEREQEDEIVRLKEEIRLSQERKQAGEDRRKEDDRRDKERNRANEAQEEARAADTRQERIETRAWADRNKWSQAWKEYEDHWIAFRTTTTEASDLWIAIPWPVESGAAEDVSDTAIERFFLKAKPDQASMSRIMEREHHKWHPDQISFFLRGAEPSLAQRVKLQIVYKAVVDMADAASAEEIDYI